MSVLTDTPMPTITEADLPADFRTPNYMEILHGTERDLVTEFKQWCKTNQVFYYARPRESFSIFEAERLAQAAGCTKLLLEDMS